MDRKYDHDYSAVHDDGGAKFFSKLIIVFNIILAILGACILALGIYITLETDFRHWVESLGMQIFWNGVYILMTAGVLVMVISFFGICGAYMKVRFLLKVMIGIMIVAIILEIVGAAYMLDHGLRGSKIEDWLRKRFYQLIDESDNYSSKRIMDIIQEWVGCCGVDGVKDYVVWQKVIPSTCYDPIKGNAWYKEGYGYVGCVRGFTGVLETKAGWISGLALFTAVIQMFCIMAACCLIRLKSTLKSPN